MSTYSPSLRVELITSGDQAGTWGTTTNDNFAYVFDTAIAGYQTVSVTSANQAFTYNNGPTSTAGLNQAVYAMLRLTTTTTAAFAVYAPPVSKQYIIWNNSGYTATIYNSTVIGNTTAAGTGVAIADGDRVVVFSNGTNFYDVKSSNITGTLAIASGGTGQTTANAAFNALAPSQTGNSGKYLTTNGTNTSWDAIDISTADITGTLGIANGGTGITSFGTGVQTALGQNVTGSGGIVLATSPTLVTPALGTPSSGVVTNLTGTASININGTVGATTPSTVAATTLTTSSTVTHNGGTANGVAYLDASKVLTTGSALTFDGSQLRSSTYLGLSTNTTPDTSTGDAIFYKASAGATLSGFNLVFETGSAGSRSEQMRLTSTGLGIGTSSPAQKLVVSNAGAAGFEFDPANAIIQTYNRSSGAYIDMLQYALNIRFFTGSSPTETMRLDSSGNLGLGVTPTAYTINSRVFQIDGGANAAEIKLTNNTSGASGTTGAVFQMAGNDLYIWNTENSFLSFGTNAAERMRLTSTGLGIGTSSPDAKLDVTSLGSASVYTVSAVIQDGNYPASGNPTLEFNGFIGGNGYRSGVGSIGGQQLAFYTPSTYGVAPTERARLDESGNLGLGVTPSAWGTAKALQIGGSGFALSSNGAGSGDGSVTWNGYYNGTNWIYSYTGGVATRYRQNESGHAWFTAPSGTAGNAITFTQAMTLDASGNLGIGTSSPTARLTVVTGSPANNEGEIRISDNATYYAGLRRVNATDEFRIGSYGASQNITFYTVSSERARITSGGDLLVGTTSAAAGERLNVTGSTSGTSWLSRFINPVTTAANNYGLYINYSGAAPNGTGNEFLFCSDTGATRATIRSNGGIANYSANDVNLSDRREKTNFAPAKSYLDTICAIPVQTFNYIDQSEDDPGLTLGVVAQDVQAVAPELVMESNWGTEDNPKMRLSIYQTDLQYALMKALQELKAEFDAYKATHP